METGYQGRVVCGFTDLRKAFDVVNHATLLHMLQAYSVRGTALEWMRSYLYDIRVSLKGQYLDRAFLTFT